jgi:hypothetical protein
VHQAGQLDHERVVPAECQIGVDPVLECPVTQRFQPGDLGLRERPVGHVRQRRPAPEREGVGRSSGFDEPLELAYVGVVGVQQVPRAVRLDDVGTAGRAERFAYLRDPYVHHRGGARRRFVPQFVDQAVGGDDLSGVQQQYGEQAPVSRAADVDRRAVGDHFERAEHAKLHRCRLRRRARAGPSAPAAAPGLLADRGK